MITAGRALTDVKTTDLQQILRLVFAGDLECPITAIGLATSGLLRLQDDLGHLRGLDRQATVAVLVAVLAERR